MLYKFYSFQNYVIDSVANESFYFSKRSQFNDPLDCNPPIQAPDYYFFKKMFYKVIDGIKNCDQEFINFAKNDDVLNILWRSMQDVELLKKRIEEVANEARILCLTTRCDHPLMWGHYADGHRGFCIGYDIKIDSNSMFSPENILQDNTLVHCREITYSNKPVDIVETYVVTLALMFDNHPKRDKNGFLSYKNALHTFKNGNVMREFFKYYMVHHLTQKHKSWAYEEETRAIIFPNLNKNNDGVHVHKKSLIKKVIFGLKMPTSQRQTIKNLIGDKGVKFYESALSDEIIGVNIEPLTQYIS